MAARLAGLFLLLLLLALAWWKWGGEDNPRHTRGGRSGGAGAEAHISGQDPASARAAPQLCRLSGIVVDEEETPLPGARIVAFPGRYLPNGARPAPLAESVSGSEGAFQLSLPKGGDLFVEVTLAGHATAVDGYHEFAGGESERFVLRPMVRFDVRVVNEDGAPIEGAFLHLLFVENRVIDGPDEPLASYRTGPDGWAEIEAETHWALLVQCTGYADRLIACSGAEPLSPIALGEGGLVEGTVVDDAGQPVSGVEIDFDRRWPHSVRTDAEGRFRLEGFWPGRLELSVSAEGYPPCKIAAISGESDARIVLDRFASLAGEVLLPGGAPAAGAEVFLDNTLLASCDASGHFRIAAWPPGWVDLKAVHGACAAESQIEIAGGIETRVTLQLKTPALSFLRLRILDRDRKPVANWGCYTEATPRELLTGPDGIVELRLPEPAGTPVRAIVRSDLPHGRMGPIVTLPTVAASGAEPTDLQLLDALTFDVRIRGPEGEPLPSSVTPCVRGTVWGMEVIETGSEGARLAVNTLGTRFCCFKVTAEGYVTFERADRSIPAQGAVLEVRMRPAARVRGRILRFDGSPADGAFAVIGQCRAEVNKSGEFTISGVAPGTVAVDAEEEFRNRERLGTCVARAGETLDIGTHTLTAPRFVRGRVVDANGRGLGGVLVEVYESEAESYTRKDGTFRVRVPARGAVHLVAVRKGYGTKIYPLETADELRIVLEAAAQAKLTVRCDPAFVGDEFRLSLRDPATGVTLWPDLEWPTAVAPGHFEYLIPDLPPGPLILVLKHEGRELTATVDVSRETIAEATVRIPVEPEAAR